ncbi:hypothetical protein CH299_28860 [Rhodococcus sp. 14-2686-1-2]|nr:hypothetical protein CH301_28345 [Rhodococcus sp. 15-1189-1-1a]OZF08175.1 hypothetical protein CH299_28860 [Rhodococcus sp. 14-2686-1-2]
MRTTAAEPNLSVPAAILERMRIRTLDGPPLPAEIAVHTALALALTVSGRPPGDAAENTRECAPGAHRAT